ncbi:MAG: TIGR03000 domain-containing protein [Gemmataceae bacterium]
MYSLVLMTAMAGGGDAPQFNGYFRDLFSGGSCNGCCGGGAARYSCYGGGCCGGSDCCGGGHAFFGVRDRVRSWWNANGCCGGTTALSGCNGCCGGTTALAGCTGCCGGTAAYSCFGGPAVSYTPVLNGGLSCYGGPVPSAPPPVFGPPQPYAAPPATIPYADPQTAPAPDRTGFRPAVAFGPPTATVSNGSRAAIVVRLPADARLYADGVPLRLTGSERRFTTPELPGGMEFTYRMTAEYDRNGEVVSVTKRVPVRSGATETVEFSDLTAARPTTGAPAPPAANPAVAAPAVAVSNPGPTAPVAPTAPIAPTGGDARATITVKLPPGAALYVDNNRNPSTESTRRFTTPPLPAGREFAYLLRVEVTRNGQPEQLSQKVAFRAGEHTEVDFSSLGR